MTLLRKYFELNVCLLCIFYCILSFINKITGEKSLTTLYKHQKIVNVMIIVITMAHLK